MKHFFHILVNLVILFYYIIWALIGIIWYGKLPKISPYHRQRPDCNFMSGYQFSKNYFEDEEYHRNFK